MSKNNIKINVHDTLLRTLSEENDYIDLPDLITKISWKLGFLYAMFMNVNLIKLNLFLLICLLFIYLFIYLFILL